MREPPSKSDCFEHWKPVMAETTAAPESEEQPMSRDWHWHPELPLQRPTIFDWPPSPKTIWGWVVGRWLGFSPNVIWMALAFVIWAWLLPETSRMRTFELGWMAQIYAKNFILLCVVAGGLQLYFYRANKQGKRRKFERRGLAASGRAFTFSNQLKDNMFWSLGSGVAFWSAYEIIYFWAYANGYVPGLTFSDNPVWFVLMFPFVMLWSSFHFYWLHRWLHWPPLYRVAHALHHRNVNVGPWSGISMHPIEHLLFFTNIAIHFVVASHPVHVLFHNFFQALGPAASHSGYESLVIKDKSRLALGDFFHQLHHRYFECNYGTSDFPWDRWFGSHHDGTSEATQRLRARIREV